jgi:hypothetical protein
MLSSSFILNQTSVKFISFKNGFACIEFVFCVKIVKNVIVENHCQSNYQQIFSLYNENKTFIKTTIFTKDHNQLALIGASATAERIAGIG